MILDIGCGGGWKGLTEFGSVIGIDISIKSLKNASKIYDLVVQADILKLPFLIILLISFLTLMLLGIFLLITKMC